MRDIQNLSNNQIKPSYLLKVPLAVILTMGLIFGSIIFAFADDGDLDPTFGTGGYITTDINHQNERANAITMQKDGKFVVVGSTLYGTYHDYFLVRYNRNGSIDNSFGTNGIVILHGYEYYNFYGYDVAMQSDGKIVITGAREKLGLLARYNSNGSLDTTFGSNGHVLIEIENTTYRANSIAIQPDGKIVVAGDIMDSSTYEYDIVVARYNTDGSLDTDFGINGFVFTGFLNTDTQANAVTLQKDGKLVIAGTISGESFSNGDFLVIRYNSDGTLDMTFGYDGVIITSIGESQFFGHGYDVGNDVVLQPDGKIVLAGYSDFGFYEDFTVVRYNEDGSLDSSFGTGGFVTTSINENDDQANALSLQFDGKIVVVGTTVYESGTSMDDFKFAAVRYNDDGSVDSSFGTNGIVTLDTGGSNEFGNDMVLQNDTKLVIVGTSWRINTYEDITLIRLSSTFIYDYEFYLPIITKN